jgi:hypothetical protein
MDWIYYYNVFFIAFKFFACAFITLDDRSRSVKNGQN